jgi:queuine tRNA-ribosyltransferase
VSERIGFDCIARDGAARCGILRTGHGDVPTPAFMPVGTQATVKTLGSEDLAELGVTISLANTYHLFLRPGVEVVQGAGGLHRFMACDHALLTDSGGFQVMSLSELNRVRDDGVEFRSHLDGSRHLLTPELAVDVQARLGADVIMSLDQCVAAGADRDVLRRAVQRTHDWAARGRAARGARFDTHGYPQALFGIVQGGTDLELRRESADGLLELDFPGYAIGGLAVGEPKPVMLDTVAVTAAMLPGDRPRYLMGVGYPDDLVRCVARGVDLFDCVLPTRNARNGMAFTRHGKLGVRHAAWARDERPLDPTCGCRVCRRYSRAYVRHLQNAGEILGLRLVTYHNVAFYLGLMAEMRAAIAAGGFDAWQAAFLAEYTSPPAAAR